MGAIHVHEFVSLDGVIDTPSRIGLLEPEERSGSASYRRYGPGSVEHLHRILSYRELGLSLDDIGALLDDPGVDRLAHLRPQERLLRDRIGRLEEMVAAVHLMIEAEHMDLELTPEEPFELFGDFDFDGYAPVAKERWGETEAYKEARRRTAGYRAPDWRAIRAEAGDIEAGLATVLSAGEPADGERAMDLAERHRAHICRWFYQCSPGAHRRLGELYVADWRFMKPFEEIAAGLAEFFRDAIVANAERLEES
jgi:DNA-binding transcriptional MerR regulator